jgi:hypothetical protein
MLCTKANALLLFIASVAKNRKLMAVKFIDKTTLRKLKHVSASVYDLSLIESHQATAALMAACYTSHAQGVGNDNKKSEVKIVW